MDYNKVYKALYLYYEEGYSNYKKIAELAEINSHDLVERIIKGRIFRSVLDAYKQDEATGDFSRTYPIPEVKVLSDDDYESLKQRYLGKLMNGKATLEEIRGFLIIDDVEPKQAQQMMEDISQIYGAMYEDLTDDKLYAVLEVLRKPEKWSIDKDGNIITIYPHPVLDKEYRVKGIEYKPFKSYEMPELLLERYCILQDEIEAVDALFKANQKVNIQPTNRKKKTGRPSKYSDEVIMQWVRMRQLGATYREIAEKYGVDARNVSYHTNKKLRRK